MYRAKLGTSHEVAVKTLKGKFSLYCAYKINVFIILLRHI